MPKKGEKWTPEQIERNRQAKLQKQAERQAASLLVAPSDEEVKVYSKQTKDNTSDLVQAFTAAIQATKEADRGRDGDLVEALSESHRRLVKPENAQAPLISAYNPLGERDNPRPGLACKEVLQCGFPVTAKSATREELDTLNKLIEKLNHGRASGQPLPTFMISKADGSRANVELKVKWDGSTGRVEKLEINYPVRNPDMRSGLYSFLTMLKEMLGEAKPDVDVWAVLSRNQALEAENQSLRLQVR